MVLTHRERMENCISGAPIDRPPVALWRHFPVDDQTAEGLAAATLNFQKTFDFDFVKVTPASSFCTRDWGIDDAWTGASEGTREYTRRVIHHPEDWENLKVLSPSLDFIAEQIRGLSIIRAELDLEVPLIQTVFNPLAQAKNLAGKELLLVHLREHPDAVLAGLETIKTSILQYIEAIKEIGVDGIFYAVQHAQYGLLSQSEFEEFSKKLDLEILKQVSDLWLNILHLHGSNVMFDQMIDYPVQILNWHDRDTQPSLKEGSEMFPGVVCGGLRRIQTMVLGTPEDVMNEARDAIDTTNGEKFILGTGCVSPIIAPHGNIMAARQSVERVSDED